MVDTTEEAEVVEEAVTGTGARAIARYIRNTIINKYKHRVKSSFSGSYEVVYSVIVINC